MENKVSMSIWDNTGREKNMVERFSESSFDGMDGVMVVYNVSVPRTFESAQKWLEVIEFVSSFGLSFSKLATILVGTGANQPRVNLPHITLPLKNINQKKKLVQQNEAIELARRYKIPYVETWDTLSSNFSFEVLVREIFVKTQPEEVSAMAQEYEIVLPKPILSNEVPITPTVDRFASKNNNNSKESKLFGWIAEGKHQELYEYLSKKRGKLNVVDKQKEGLLHHSARKLSSSGLDPTFMLLVGMADTKLDMVDKLGRTALHILSEVGNEDAVSLLLKSKASPSIKDKRGNLALHLACVGGHVSVARLLLEKSKDIINICNDSGMTPLYLSASKGHALLVSLLLEQGAVLIPEKKLLDTPLHAAAMGGHLQVVKLITSKFRDSVDSTNKQSYTPIYLAIESGNLSVVNVLLDVGANVREGIMHPRFKGRFMCDTFLPAQIQFCHANSVKKLDLSHCLLDKFPTKVLEFVWLENLNLSFNQITIIPKEISIFTNLKHLNLSNNQITHLPSEMTDLKQLQTLELQFNVGISSDLARVILNFIASKHRILDIHTTLDLSDLGLTNTSLELQSLVHLTQLALNANKLTHVPQELSSLTNLNALWLQDNYLSDISSISSLPKLELLKLSNNQLTSLPHLSLPKMRELWLEGNYLVEIPSSVSELPSLERLWLDRNKISTLEFLPSKFASLLRLSLRTNKLSKLADTIGILSKLERLWVDENRLSFLPASLGKLTNLRTLSLCANKLEQVPSELAQLYSLMELNLDNNKLLSLNPKLGELTSLTRLSLRSNHLQTLPATLGHLAKLKTLELKGNLELRSPTPETVKMGTKEVIGFLRDLMKDSVPCFRLKLMVVGQENVGKVKMAFIFL